MFPESYFACLLELSPLPFFVIIVNIVVLGLSQVNVLLSVVVNVCYSQVCCCRLR